MIITKLVGGLGNQMFQYAIARNLAKKNMTSLKLDIAFLLDRTPRRNFIFRNYDLDLLNIKEDFTYPSKIAIEKKIPLFPRLLSALDSRIRYKIYQENSNFKYDSLVLSLKDNIYLKGYWQSEKYFKEIEHIIRKEFSFKSKLDNKSLILANKINTSNSICLNVRRTDYVTNQDTNKLLGNMNLNYFQNAYKVIIEKVINPYFYIFSDDIEWCRNNLKLKSQHEFIGHEYAGYKFSSYLQLMIKCKHFIIPNSTFAWWAAWLSANDNKIVIGPDKWFRDKNMNNNDILPNSWIRI